jgi:hypothetical protein
MAPPLEARKNRSESHIRQDFFTSGGEETKIGKTRTLGREAANCAACKDQSAALRLSCQRLDTA